MRAWVAFRWDSQAATSETRESASGMRRFRHCWVRMLSSVSARFVFRSDVNGYYANIDHAILLRQLGERIADRR